MRGTSIGVPGKISRCHGQRIEKNFGNFFNKYPFDGKESSRRKQMQELFKLDIHDADSQCATSRGAGCTLKWNLEAIFLERV